MPNYKDKIRVQNADSRAETNMALLVFAAWERGEPRAIWFPKSQIDDDSEVWENDQEGEFVCSEWVALQKEII